MSNSVDLHQQRIIICATVFISSELTGIRDDFNPFSNIVEESHQHEEKHFSSNNSIDEGRIISTKPV
jgi:hypothetical protein